ncbi:MAG: CheR family methyltransferase, partial [Cyclobacteriaceae bacterium]
NEKEVHNLYNDFLINVTSFFRDPDFFTTLDNEVFPSIAKRKATDLIRIWVAGCATGEEAYSIAISLTEYLEKEELNISFQIFGSDLDARAIEKARIGTYPASALQNVSQQHLKQFFKKIDGHYQIEKSIRESCIFSQQNLLKDPPFSRMDLVSCQNVMIYLETDPQQRLLQTFHYSLKPGGYLFLGKSESIGGAIDLFQPLDKKVRIFTRKAAASPPLEFSTQTTGPASTKGIKSVFLPSKPDIEKEISKILLTRFVQPSVVLNPNLNIIQFFGVTAPYLSPVVGKASFSVLKMIREEMVIDLRALLQQARKTEKAVSKEGIKIYDKKTEQEVTIEVIPKRNESELFYLVVFKENQSQRLDNNRKGKKSSKTTDQKDLTIIKLEDELIESRELIRTTNEEYETTYEELQSYNEETLSSNEELQSVNEELETSKEELQSANEELTTINDELQKRNIELKESQNYAKAIVDTVNSPFLILTSNLQVRSANRSFYNTFKLTPEKTEGSFVYELGDHTWDIPVFRGNLNELLAKKPNFLEFQLKHDFSGVGELIFIVNAYRLLKEDPKETLILLAFINISDVLKANLDLKQLNQHLEQFAYVTSHDLQEPLRKIQTFSNYLAGHENLDSFTTKYVDKINATAVRMSTLLNDLLSYSLLLKNREKEFVPVDLNKTIANVCKDLELSIDEKKAELSVESLPEILGEPVQINQLFYNLISNALKFNNAKPVINISVEKVSLKDFKNGLKEGRRYACICVKDNGIGFDQKYADKIFTLFQRLHDKPDVKGSGMGLAICKKIVEDHGGAIFAESNENEGATFWIFLPTA